MAANKIKKQILDIRLTSQHNSYQLQKDISGICQQQLAHAIDEVLTAAATDNIVSIERLSLDLGVIRMTELSQDLVSKTQDKLAKALDQALKNIAPPLALSELQPMKFQTGDIQPATDTQIESSFAQQVSNPDPVTHQRSPEKRFVELLAYYCLHGSLPWWGQQKSLTELIAQRFCHPATSEQHSAKRQPAQQPQSWLPALRPLLSSPLAARRMVRLLSQTQYAWLLALLQNHHTSPVAVQQSQQQYADFVTALPEHLSSLLEAELQAGYLQYVASTITAVLPVKNSHKTRDDIRQAVDWFVSQHAAHKSALLTEPSLLQFSHLAGWLRRFNHQQLLQKLNEQLPALTFSHADYQQLFTQLVGQQADGSPLDAERPEHLCHATSEPVHHALWCAIFVQLYEQPDCVAGSLFLTKARQQGILHKANRLLEKELATARASFEGLTSEAAEDYYISNAGLVLLWPFLPRFLAGLELVQGTNVINVQQAVLLLHYLVHNTAPDTEHDLLLNKVLMGLSVTDMIDTDAPVSDTQLQAGKDLLNATIVHWSALKKVSVPWLQQVFLQRNGVLRPSGAGWLLQIEGSAPDVLLKKLPWAVSTVKLPWMAEMINVEWRY